MTSVQQILLREALRLDPCADARSARQSAWSISSMSLELLRGLPRNILGERPGAGERGDARKRPVQDHH